MQLMIYTHSFAPRVGGVETVVMTLAEGLARMSEADEPRTVAGTRPGGRASPSTEGKARIVVTVVTPTPAGEMDDGALAFRVVRQPGFLELFRLLREADLVHLAGPTLVPLALCLLLQKPVVIEHHGFQAVCPNGQLFYAPEQTLCPGHFMAGRHRECLRCNAAQGRLRSLRMWLATFPRRWLSRRAAAHVMPTRWLSLQLRLAPAVTILHGVELSRERPDARARPPAPSFAFIGRLASTKGVPVLLEAAARLREQGYTFELKIIGEGPERARLDAMARGLGLEDCARFLGLLPPEAAAAVLEDAWATVVPSLAGEVFGLAVAQQMMRGQMVIASDLGALGEVLGDAGLKFNPGDVDGLCACLRRVLDHPEIAREYGAKARERARNLFRCDRMVEEHRQLYREITRAG
jgi:glycosyltransferase involved in cell wall biosynthesis